VKATVTHIIPALGINLRKLDIVLQKLHAENLKVDMEKITFATKLFEYLGYHITPSSIFPLNLKLEAKQQLKLPKTMKQLR
jgi:hypothetical protein